MIYSREYALCIMSSHFPVYTKNSIYSIIFLQGHPSPDLLHCNIFWANNLGLISVLRNGCEFLVFTFICESYELYLLFFLWRISLWKWCLYSLNICLHSFHKAKEAGKLMDERLTFFSHFIGSFIGLFPLYPSKC